MAKRPADRPSMLQAHAWAAAAFLVASPLLPASTAHAAAPASCAPVVARIVSVEGTVKVAASENAPLEDATSEQTLCAGNVVEVGDRSRAALQLANETTIRLDQRSRLILSGFAAEQPSGLALTRGALHVITRTRQRFQVTTPFVNANVNGTEFTVRVESAGAAITVVEGEVAATRGAEALAVHGGESVVSRPSEPLRKEIAVRRTGAVEWALYYPAVFDCGIAGRITSWRAIRNADQITELCRAGKFGEAIARLEVDAREDDARVLTLRAGMLLGVGRYDEAKTAIESALRLDANDSVAYALESILVLVRDGDGAQALQLANRAVALDRASAPAAIALSYAEQAAFRIDRALEAVRAIPPEAKSAAAWARLAELYLSTGDIEAAQSAARRAIELDPSVAKAYAIQGYALLLGTELDAAARAFEQAIARDQADPFARLGLGLTRIRGGDLERGRELLEVAAILDPGSSLVRSYLGKAYYEEKRDALAAEQYELAKTLDPNDPTPWLYDAILKLVSNRPVDALDDLNESSRRNDNRAVYRSRLLLDDDEAARTTDRAAIYAELGFEKLSVSESAEALAENFTNDAAHRQLAASYIDIPRHDIARVSEALQSQVRQPLTIVPVDPLLALDNLVIPRDIGPTRLGANEYTQLYSRNQVRLEADGVVGTRSTAGDQVLLSAIADRFAFAASQLHYESDGFQDNNAVRKNAYDFFVQSELSPRASLQFDVRRTDFSLDQPYFQFDPTLAFVARITETNDTARIGGRYTFDPGSDLIWSVFYQDRTRISAILPDVSAFTRDDTTTVSGEMQYTRQFGLAQVTAGLVATQDNTNFPVEQIETRTHSATAYVYSTWGVGAWPVKLVAGLSYDWFHLLNTVFDQSIERHRFNPKLGVIWTPATRTTVRGALTWSVKRPFVASQTFEPTQVAGFNQFFTGFDTLYGDTDGTVSRRGGVAIDQQFGKDWYAGAEWTERRLTVPNFNVGENDWHENTAYGYLYKTWGASAARWQGALSVDYEYEKLRRPQLLTGPEAIVDVATNRLQFGIRAFDRSGITLRAATSYVHQSGTFSADINFGQFEQGDQGWITDVSLDYRLPGRLGIVGIGARNVFDTRINLFETDPVNPRFATRRLVFAKAQLQF